MSAISQLGMDKSEKQKQKGKNAQRTLEKPPRKHSQGKKFYSKFI